MLSRCCPEVISFVFVGDALHADIDFDYKGIPEGR